PAAHREWRHLRSGAGGRRRPRHPRRPAPCRLTRPLRHEETPTMTDTAFDTDRDVRPAALIVTLPPLDDRLPDDAQQAAAAYEPACEQWSAADASIEEIAGRIANADHEDARRIAAAARAGDNLDDVELVDRRQLTEDHHRAVLTARALAGRLHDARLHLL